MAFIGLGIMGKPMSKTLLKAGYSLVVSIVILKRLLTSLPQARKRHSTARAIAERCDVIIVRLALRM
ncbi:hypothetical protein KCP69_06385 [Salmonella enterica subsp. enterica]|nr:hypothetical protein KCP69_06385 [Salmonella enterica subsp. enterica]